ncbi:hypothetical protein LAZ67_5004222 [Cordylochernes scorpioides]|uniref:RNA-directed DNA polymerase n=1 Tax=Cordylochernes scorpioides TaxID=51811 RepID=A0ABY6KLE1_9ARAC|nr:hypothetical protein LAZ67_5004222 [Cordylochernes scorpioides]
MSSLYQIEKLNKQNFETWRLQMQMILVHSDLWIYVNEANIKPEPGNQEFTNWQNKDQKALATIVLSLNPSELIHVKNCKTAEEAWKKIEEVYRPKGPATRVSLTKRLIQMKMRPNDDLKDYLSKFTSLVDNLGEIGAQVPEDFLVILLLCSLPESYEGFRTAIETRDELPKLETLKVKIIEEDQRQREMEGTSSGEQNAFFGNPERKTTNSTKPPNRKDFKFNCHYCGKKGHKAADCWSKRNSRTNNTRMAASLGIRDENILDVNEWCLDSGATAHMGCLRTAFSDLRETEPIPVKLVNDQSIEALGTGTVQLEVLEHGEPFLLKLENVLFVPGLKGNLISVSTCTEKSFFVKFMRGKAEIVNPLRKICIEAYKRNGLYILRQTKYAKTQFTRMCIDKNSSEIWHNRFGHLNFDDLRKLQRENLVNGLPKGEFKSITSCETCIRGKQTRLPFPEISLTKSTEPLQLIHSDICGPMRTKSYGGALYFATFIDDFSRMIFTFVMKRKSEIFKGFKLFKRFAEKQTGKKIKAIRSDNAAEYLSSDFKEYLSEEGIRHQLSVEYSPQQNGVAERANRTLVEMTRCFIIQANLPDPLWAELVHTSTYIRNRCPRTNESRTPYEIFTGRKPTVSHLRIIGCKCFAVDNRPRRGKFAPRSEEYRLIGYSPESKAYRLWKPGTGMMIKSRDVRFLESENSTSRNDVVQIEAIPQKKVDISLEEESLQDDENTLPGTDSDFLGEPSETMEVISQRGRGRPRYIRTGKPGRPRKEYPTANLSTQEFSEVKYSPDPKDAEEALSGKDSYFWRKAMKEEFDSLIENKTWELVDPPKGQNVIGSKWVFRRKYSSDGSLERYKARLVAKGYSQKYGIDYEETFAPVVRHSTIRTVLALAVEYDLLVHQMDVQSAFLNGDVKEEIYMTQPENFESKKYPRRVCKLKKAIYGLKQAGMTWHAKLDSVLKEMGLEQMKTDNCVYIKREEGVLLVTIYVDDLIIAAERKDTLISFKESMKKIFKIKDLGKINYCLGIRIQTEKDGSISIDQEKYIEELLAKYRMKEAKPISTPMDSNSKLTKISSIEGENEPVKKEEYQSLIGSLIYLSVSTRPDIAYAVSALGQFSNDPRRQHWNAAKRVLRYLKGTLCLKITYEKTNETLYGCVDADWGGNLADRKSQTGLVFFLARGPIAWESKKQQTVALSSTESEYIALCEAGKEAVYLRTLLDEMGFGELLNEPTVLKTDNQGAQQLARNPVHHARTKHIDIKWHYIRSICSDGLIEVVHIPTQENVADILTKALDLLKNDRRARAGHLPPSWTRLRHLPTATVMYNTGTHSVTDRTLPKLNELTCALTQHNSLPTSPCASRKLMIKEFIEQRPELTIPYQQLLYSFKDIFSINKFNVLPLNITPVKLKIISDKVISLRPYRTPYAYQKEIQDQISQLLKHDIITPSSSPYSSPVTLVRKRDNTMRLCIDFHRVNELVPSDLHPLPLIETVLDNLSKARVFSTVDISNAYYQIPIAEESQPLLSFVTQQGQYNFKRLPFGFKSAPQIFERVITQLIHKHHLSFIAHYYDDFVIFSDSSEQHLTHLRLFFKFCLEENLQPNLKKCNFYQNEIDFLGYHITAGTYTPNIKNTEIINAIRTPINIKTLQSFLGAVNVCHKFIPEYARLRHPLNQLLKKNAKWLWSPNCQQAFDKLKQHLATQPVLHLFQEGLPCQVYCDASTQGIAGVLKQVHPDGNIYPVQYYSRALRSYERNYTISELECLAIVECVDKFRVYLQGTRFVIYSDHHALQWLKTIKDPTGRLFRWSLRLSAYDYEVKYLKGSRQYEADLLSRNPFCGFLSTGQIKDHQGELRRDTRYILNDKDLMTITRRGVTKIIVPPSLRGTLLQRAHRDFNHPGISQMTRLIAAQYYWDGMTNDIRAHVRTCSVCQLVKPPKGPIYGELGQLPPAVLPYELVSLDTISGFAKYGNSQTFLHVVVDHATRYAWAFPSRSTSILTYTQVIKKVMQFGFPKRLLTDRAPAFTSPKFRRFLIRHNIDQLLTTSNNPQANGLSERLNATITGKLKLLRLQQPKTAWTKLLPQVLQAYNHTPHSVTGFPPSYLLLGIFPLQLSEHVQNYPKIDDARELAYQRTHERHLRDKARFDQTHRASDFEVGDLVLAKTYHYPDTGKLAPFFSGPYEILEIISPQIVRINRSNRPLSRETDTIHVNKLKHYTETEQFISPPVNDRDQPKNTFNFPYKHFNHTLIHTKTAINSRKQHDYTYNQDDQRYLNHLSPEIFTNY